MDIFITAVICIPAGMVAGGVLTALFRTKVTTAVMVELEAFKTEIRSRLK